VTRDLRHNLVVLGLDYGLFMVALSFASQTTILPAFAAHLGAPNVVVGAIPAVMTVGWLLPALFAAGYTEALPRKLPFVIRFSLWERVPFVVLALAAFFLAEPAPRLTLALLLAGLFVITGTGGILMPAWMDVVGGAVPVRLRGRFFGLSNLGASAAGFAGGFLTERVLTAVPPPRGYGVCFLLATLFVFLSFGALLLVREQPGAAPGAAPPLRAHLARVPALLGRDRNLRWFLAARACSVVAQMAAAFYTVHALRAFAPPASEVGVFTALLLGGQAAGYATLGSVADRAGHRAVLLVGAGAAVAANAAAVAAPSLAAFGAVFVLAGVQIAAHSISNLTILLEFAPTPAERPTYVGLGTTAIAPVAFLSPLAAGLLADAAGFPAMFAAAGLAGVAALALFWRVRDPRASPGEPAP
jgi:MFS family permease